MLFKHDTLTYYVALFQAKNFWRVLKTQDRAKAEKTYGKFSKESADLAKADLRSITLQAQYEHTQKEVNERLDKVNMLQNDLDAQRHREIGRESCRENVCQYVSISGVAGSLKKKT